MCGAPGFLPLLAVLLGAEIGQLVEVAVEQGLHPEQHLDPLAHRRVAPGGKGFGCRLDGLLNLVGRALRRERDHRAGRRIETRHVFLAGGFLPLAADAVLQLLGPLAADGIGLPSRSGGKIVVEHGPLLVFRILSRRGRLRPLSALCRRPPGAMCPTDSAVVRPSRHRRQGATMSRRERRGRRSAAQPACRVGNMTSLYVRPLRTRLDCMADHHIHFDPPAVSIAQLTGPSVRNFGSHSPCPASTRATFAHSGGRATASG
jgi:hypothetical protein